MEKNKSFKNKLLPLKMSFGRLGLSFDNPTKEVQKMPKNFVQRLKRLNFFSKKNFFKIFPLTRRMQIWQPSPKILDKNPKSHLWMSEKD